MTQLHGDEPSVSRNAAVETSRDELAGLRCVVLGGASGMGAAAADRLRVRGAQVMVGDIHRRDVPQHEFIHIDVADEASVREGLEEVARELGGIDVVVNTSGVLGAIQSIEHETLEEFEHLVRVNLTGPFLVSKYALPYLLQSSSGRLVHFSSTAGKEGVSHMPGYSASKAGVMGLVKALAKEYAHTPVTVNAVAPGKVESPMIAHTPPSDADLARIPMGRLGRPEEAGALVEYIVSPAASYTTGVIFDLSGGRATY